MGDMYVWLAAWLYGMVACGCAKRAGEIGGASVPWLYYWLCGLFWPYGVGRAIATLALKEGE